MTRIELRAVSKYYDDGATVANHRIDLEVVDGELFVLLGPSGSGKTATLGLVAGLERPTRGDVYFDGEAVTGRSPSDRNLAMVFRNYALYQHTSVTENIAYPLKVRCVPPKSGPGHRGGRGPPTYRDLLEKRPAEPSGGERQCSALAPGRRGPLLGSRSVALPASCRR